LAFAERRYGKLGLKRVMEPAIKLAREGFVLSEDEAKELTDADLAKFPDSKRIFQRDGEFYKAGETFRQPELAETLKRIAADPGDFYHGKMARELVEELKKGGGLITLEDLAQYTVEERAPITAGERAEYAGGVRSEKAGRPEPGVGAFDHGGIPACVHGSRRVPWRSGL
jgi:gamma-glutamyltranspeptidase/glutathione hydrolase